MAELRATVDDILSWDPCDDWPEDRIREMADGRESVSALEALDLPIEPEDRLWLVLRPEMIAEPQLHELACVFAESVLDIFEREYPDDLRPRKAIEAKRRWLKGEISDSELAAARAAAGTAAGAAALSAAAGAAAAWAAAAWTAAGAAAAWAAAAWTAAWAATAGAAAAGAAAGAAARAAARAGQIEIVRGLLMSEVVMADKTMLLPCPWCGSDNVSGNDDDRSAAWVECYCCGAEGPYKASSEAAACEWNRVSELVAKSRKGSNDG